MWTETHFELSDQELDEIRRKRDLKRSRKKFTEMLSSEAQAAMRLARQDTLAMLRDSKSDQGDGDLKINKKNSETGKKSKKRISFHDVYEKTPSFRMEGDITRNSPKLPDPAEFAINALAGNGDSGTETNDGADNMAIEETAKLNSVHKCLVWMEVTDNESGNSNPHG